MKKREADFGVLFRHWIRANPLKTTCHFELKQTQGDSIPFSCLEEQQIAYGEAVMTSPKGVLTRVQGTNGESDYIYSYRDPVYIVIKYPGMFCIIQLATLLDEKETSTRKSLTSLRARQIAWEVVELKKKK